jgi:hypothetical protein
VEHRSDRQPELVNMTRDEFRTLIKDSVREELTACGLLITTPAEKLEAQEDFAFIRKWRKKLDGASNKIGYAIIFGIVSILGSLLAAGFTAKFGK